MQFSYNSPAMFLSKQSYLPSLKCLVFFLSWNITSYLKLYSDYTEVNCFWFFLVNSCWLIYELMLVFANLTIRTKICFYILICTRFLRLKVLVISLLACRHIKKNGMSRKFKAPPKNSTNHSTFGGCVAFRQIYETYRRLNLLFSLTSSVGFPASNRCCSESAHIASGFSFLINLSSFSVMSRPRAKSFRSW